jgi:translation initiation factor RLI1
MYEIRKNVPYSPANVRKSSARILSGENLPQLPPINGPHELNVINEYAYALLAEAVRDMTPREVSFVANMCKANALTKKQDKWLRDLYKKYAQIEIPATTA